MPEGDTVWRTARRLHRALAERALTGSDFRVPRHASVDLSGQVVHEVVARGKHLLHRIGDDTTLHTHLKMEGAWHLYRPASRWRRPGFQARVVLQTDAWLAVGFDLGAVDVVRRAAEHDLVGHLGPDLLGTDWDAEEAVRRLRRDPDRQIGDALLDQRNLAGIGNLYKSEVCFLTGTDPYRRVGDVDLPRIVARAHALLQANKERAEQTTTGDRRAGSRTWVYRRGGQPCRRCGTTVRAVDQQGAAHTRQTFWCPHCQPLDG
ncbi:MAG TPA: DNA-formamidopyrimidine glycosylase family protein [Nocardioidaceae bacterium]|nr:DNA-formamidopyrimidine glycosylase family protein [Nocardioidaceae bacterium]